MLDCWHGAFSWLCVTKHKQFMTHLSFLSYISLTARIWYCSI